MPRLRTRQRIDSPRPLTGVLRRVAYPLARLIVAGLGTLALWVSLDAAAARDPDYMILARICMHEARWQGHVVGECAALRDVIRDRADVIGTSFAGAAYAYSDKVFDRNRKDRHRWIAWLREDLREPRGWPRRNIPWSKRAIDTCVGLTCREAWRRTIEESRRLMGPDNPPSLCEVSPHHWGDRYTDLERARRMKLWEVDCGETRNLFWVVPRRMKAEDFPSPHTPHPVL